MKRILLLVLFTFSISISSAQYVTLNDTAFRDWIDLSFPGAIVGGQLDTTNAQIISEDTVKIINSNSNYGTDFFDLDGIRYFDNCRVLILWNNNMIGLAPVPPLLECLNIFNNSIAYLPSLPNSITEMNVDNNALTTLPALPSSLEYLYAGENNLISLPTLPPSIEWINCRSNNLQSLPALPTSLGGMAVHNNALTSLPPLPTFMSTLSASNNNLTMLPALPQQLQRLTVNDNQLTSLPSLPNILQELKCSNNLLTNLPVLVINLKELYIANNNISSLPTLPGGLRELDCDNNSIVSFGTLPGQLRIFKCTNNQLACLPKLPNPLTRLIYIQGNSISCLPNHPNNLDQFSDPLMPLCAFSTSICPAYSILGGKIFIDTNADTIYNSPDVLINNVPVSINQGAIYTSSTKGLWSYPVDPGSTYVAEANYNLPYFSVHPDTFMINLPGQYTLDTNNNFALLPNGSFEDLQIDIIENGTAPRPGFIYTQRLAYRNIGTVSQIVNIDLIYNSTYVSYVSSTGVTPTQTANTLSFPIGNFNIYENGFIDIVFQIDPTTPLGTQLTFFGDITPNVNDQTPLDNTDDLTSTVIGSFDPNDKLVSLEEISPINVQNKVFLEYSIRFQNTGTAEAINIRLEDSLDLQLEWSSFQYMSSSHPANWTLDSGMLTVDYNGINLPDSSTNQALSNGYFKFKIRVKDNLIVGDEIENFADIFFDFNSPIRTNTIVTEVVITTDINDGRKNLEFSISPNPSNGEFSIVFSLPQSKTGTLEVLDLTGRIICSHSLPSRSTMQKINLDHAAEGMYHCVINSDGMQVSKKIVLLD